VDLGDQVVDAYTLTLEVGVRPDPGIHRQHIVLPAGLHAEAAEIEQHAHLGLDLAGEFLSRLLEVRIAEVHLEIDHEPAAVQLLGEGLGVCDGGGKGRLGFWVGCVPDDQRQTRGPLLTPSGRRCQDEEHQAKPRQKAHFDPAPSAPIRLGAAILMS
jgi:hypothetical protein